MTNRPVLARLALLGLIGHTLGQETIVSARIIGITDGDMVKALAPGNPSVSLTRRRAVKLSANVPNNI
jgi:hypothetical protein